MARQGVSTRDALKVMAGFGLESLSSAQASRATARMDAELEAWRTRRLGAFPTCPSPCLFLGRATRRPASTAQIGSGWVRDAAILSAIEGQEAFDPISEGDRASRPWREAQKGLLAVRGDPHRAPAGRAIRP